MDFNFSFTIDYSSIKGSELKSINTNFREIRSVLNNENMRLYDGTKGFYVIGYSIQKRIIGIYFDTETNKCDIRLTKVSLPDEKKIQDFYCCC